MKTLVLIFAIAVLACKGSAKNDQQAGNDTAQTPLKDTPLSAAPADSAAQRDTTTLGGTWFLQPVLVSDTATGRIPRLEFNLRGKKFSGNTGCNSMSGSFSYTDSTLDFDRNMITTKTNCVGYNERAFLENLLRTNRYRLDNGILILMFDETELSRWTRKVAPKPVSNKT